MKKEERQTNSFSSFLVKRSDELCLGRIALWLYRILIYPVLCAYMIIVKALKNSEDGNLSNPELREAMSKYNEKLVKAEGHRSRMVPFRKRRS